jgi:antitoxin ParD1/3/4
MASTSLSLGEHWETFIKREVASGRYGSASEVIRDALRHMEERNSKLAALRAHLAEGEAQAPNGEIVEDYSIEAVLAESDREGAESSATPTCARSTSGFAGWPSIPGSASRARTSRPDTTASRKARMSSSI